MLNAEQELLSAQAQLVTARRNAYVAGFSLLAAMGRASGLPSRVVAGLVYVPELEGKTNVMGYHLWTQFHLRGRWVDFDAALGESECAPTRIALMASSLDDSSLTELGLALLDYIGQVEIKVTKVE